MINIFKEIGKKVLSLKTIIGGINPFFNIFHFQYLAVYQLNNFIKKNLSSMEGTVLDLGCGKKPYSRFYDSSKWLGVDISKDTYADKLMLDNKYIPYEDSSFDLVFSTNVIEHIEDLDTVILEIQRVLKDDGKILISIPFLFNNHSAPYDYRRYTKEGLIDKFE